MSEKEEKYWVASECEVAEKVYFSADCAINSGYTFLDSFDTDGNKVNSYELSGDQFGNMYVVVKNELVQEKL